MYKIIYTKQAQKDAQKIKEVGLQEKVIKLLSILSNNPYQENPPFEKLIGDLTGAYSRRINIQHRLIYQIYESKKVIKIIRMWTHYE
jgi:toxin YoeB